MKNILITGASGWLGINLIKTFIKGIDLYPETHDLNKNSSINVFIPNIIFNTDTNEYIFEYLI